MINQSKSGSQERTYWFTLKIIELIDKLPKETSTQIIAKQLLRSASSIGANIAEAKGSSSRKDFTNYFNYSLKSAHETVYWLGLLKDANKFDKEAIDSLVDELKEITRILGSSILTLKSKPRFNV